MVLKGGSLKFIDGNKPEDVILEILQDHDTTIILVSENQQVDKNKGIGILAFWHLYYK